MSKPVILTGIRANNDLHIGNYLGAILPIVDMAKYRSSEYQINLFVPDLHSFTTPIDHSELQNGVLQNLRVFAAAGLPLDNTDVHMYRQSYISAHSELAWILSCFTGFGELSRMTEFKDKSARLGIDHIGVGQFIYPPLMAADILLYDAIYVPVGDDQRQNLEYTRNIAERMNSKFGNLFVVPKPVKEQHEFFGKDQGLRIMDLADPLKKMSKSTESDKGIIFMTDSEEKIRSKIMSATTDSIGKINYDKQNQPGISNLIDLLALFSNKTLEEVSKDFLGQEQYGPLKNAVADALVIYLAHFQENLQRVSDEQIMSKLEASEASQNAKANQTLLQVQKAVGLRS